MTTVYSAKDRVDIGIGASKIIDVLVENKQMWAFIDIPRHPDKHSITFDDLGNGKMQVTNNSRWVVSLWPAQPFLGRKEYKKAVIAAKITDIRTGMDIDVLNLTTHIKNMLRDNGIFTVESLIELRPEHIKTFRGIGYRTVDVIYDAIDEWRNNNEGNGTS